MGSGFKTSSEDIVFEEFDGDLVVLNLATGQYFGLNQSGATAWRALMDGASAESLFVPGAEDAVPAFVARLVELELLAEAGESAETVVTELSDPPTIEIFDDLADLIMADPIHDIVPQEGWPRLPEGS